jgi:hypothetical protein
MEKGLVDENFLQAKITEVSDAAADAKPLERGNAIEKELKPLLYGNKEPGAGASSEPKENVKTDLPETEPEKFGAEHKNKKTATNPLGAGHRKFNDECTCEKCRWLKAHQSSAGTTGGPAKDKEPGENIPGNVDVIAVMENKMLLEPAAKIFGFKDKELNITSDEQEFLNQLKPEDVEIKRSMKVYWGMNILFVLSKVMMIVTRFFIKVSPRFKQEPDEVKKAA